MTIDSGADRTPCPPVVAIVAARDEADVIEATLCGLRRGFGDLRLWVADDGSRDQTAELARAAGADVVRAARRGKGQAMTLAAGEALAHHGAGAGPRPVFVLCDADLGGSAELLAALVRGLRAQDCEIAVARFAVRRGGGFGIVVRSAAWAVAHACGLRLSAPLSGQRALTADALQQVLPFAGGYGMEVGMTIDAVSAGMRVSEIELDLSHRHGGRDIAGFAHRARQLADVVRAYLARR